MHLSEVHKSYIQLLLLLSLFFSTSYINTNIWYALPLTLLILFAFPLLSCVLLDNPLIKTVPINLPRCAQYTDSFEICGHSCPSFPLIYWDGTCYIPVSWHGPYYHTSIEYLQQLFCYTVPPYFNNSTVIPSKIYWFSTLHSFRAPITSFFFSPLTPLFFPSCPFSWQ